MKLFINIVMKQIYLFNIVAWNYRKKKRVSGLQKGKFHRPSSVPEARKERSCQSYSASHIEWRAERSFHRPTFIRPVQKKRDHKQSCCFADINLLLFCRSRWRHRRRCSSSLLLKRQESQRRNSKSFNNNISLAQQDGRDTKSNTRGENCARIQQ